MNARKRDRRHAGGRRLPRYLCLGLPLGAVALVGALAGARSQPSEKPTPAAGQNESRGPRRGGRQGGRGPAPVFRTEVPDHPVDLLLGRPTRTSVTCSVLAYQDGEGSLVYGTRSGAYSAETPSVTLRKGEPREIPLTGLTPDTHYYYRLRTTTDPMGPAENGPEHSFHTARPAGSPFTFTVQADSHLDGGTDPEVYRKSLACALASRPDFHIDLGDTFMTDKYADYHQAAPQYLAQRYYLGLLSPDAPVFLALGNHDGEDPSHGPAGPDSMAAWSNGMRKRYFPNPLPDDFYTGNRARDRQSGLLQDYYAWSWGDAQFIVLDPFWYSTRTRGRGETVDNWGRTLGVEQYDWLQRTLEASRARFRFVFIHHLVGGETREGRGGAEASRFFEWGGADLDGTSSFGQRRPGWRMPIHELLVKHHVSIVFHGHDHLYARQERDSVIYQEVPQPSHSQVDNTRSAADYGYRSGTIGGSSGILRVAVSPESTQVEYVRAYPSGAEGPDRRTGSVTQRYTIASSR